MQNFFKYLNNEGLIVVCSILPIFTEKFEKDKNLFEEYIEIFTNSTNQVILNKTECKRLKKKINIIKKYYKLNMSKTKIYELNSNGSIEKISNKMY